MFIQFIEQRRKEINAACRVIKEKTPTTLSFGKDAGTQAGPTGDR
jgi:hypothetical protein